MGYIVDPKLSEERMKPHGAGTRRPKHDLKVLEVGQTLAVPYKDQNGVRSQMNALHHLMGRKFVTRKVRTVVDGETVCELYIRRDEDTGPG